MIDTYTYGLQRINSKGETNETYLYDGRGSVTGTVNASNDFVSYSYTAYGDLMPSSPQPKVFGFNGEQTDVDTGMQYLRARYYDTGLGRFFQEDIYRGNPNNPKSMHRYMYVYSNPINYVDRSGFRPVELTTENKHTMQQVKQITHADLLKEYQQKKLEAIANSQDDDFRQIQQMKEDVIRKSGNGQGNGGVAQTPSLEEQIANCTFDQVNSMIYDDMDFSKYTVNELQVLYDKIDSLDVGKKDFDNVSNMNKFMRQLKRYIKDITPKTPEDEEKWLENSWLEDVNDTIYDWMNEIPEGTDILRLSNLTESMSDIFGASYGMSDITIESKTVGNIIDKYILGKTVKHGYYTGEVNVGNLASMTLAGLVLGIGVINTWTADSGNTNEQRLIKTATQVASVALSMLVGISAVAVAVGGAIGTLGVGTPVSIAAGAVILIGGLMVINNFKETVYETYDIG